MLDNIILSSVGAFIGLCIFLLVITLFDRISDYFDECKIKKEQQLKEEQDEAIRKANYCCEVCEAAKKQPQGIIEPKIYTPEIDPTIELIAISKKILEYQESSIKALEYIVAFINRSSQPPQQ